MKKILTLVCIGVLSVSLIGCSNSVEKEVSKENKEIVEKVVVEKKEKCPIAIEQEEYDYFLNHYNEPKKLMSSIDDYSIRDISYSDKYFLIRKEDKYKTIVYIYDYEYNLIEIIEHDNESDVPNETLMCTDGEENNSIMLINFNNADETKRSLQIHKKIIGDNSEPKLYIEIPCEENEYISAFEWTKRGLFLVKKIHLEGGDTKNILYLLDNSKNLVKIMEYDNQTYVSDMKDDWLLMGRDIRKDTGNDKVIHYKNNREIFKYNFKTKEKVNLPALSYLSHVKRGTLNESDTWCRRLSFSFFNSTETFLARETLTDNVRHFFPNRTLVLGSEFALHSFEGFFQGYIKDGFIYTVKLNKEDLNDSRVDLYVVKKDNLNKE